MNGHICYLVDEDWEIVSGDKQGILLDNNFYSTDSSGWILVPYGNQKWTEKCILMNNDFAQLADFDWL